MFEVRGCTRAKRGTMRPPMVENGEVVLRYTGLDEVERTARIQFTPDARFADAEPRRLRARYSVGDGNFDLSVGHGHHARA